MRLANEANKKHIALASTLEVGRLASSQAVQITNLKNNTAIKIAIPARVPCVVDCNDCLKPRCMFSLSAVSQIKPPLPPTIQNNSDGIVLTPAIEMQKYRAMARDKSHDATESTIFVCGMAPMDADDPFHDVLHCDSSLDCNAHIEAHFYTYKIQHGRVEMCCYCAGEFDSPVEFSSGVALFPQDTGWALLHCASFMSDVP